MNIVFDRGHECWQNVWWKMHKSHKYQLALAGFWIWLDRVSARRDWPGFKSKETKMENIFLLFSKESSSEVKLLVPTPYSLGLYMEQRKHLARYGTYICMVWMVRLRSIVLVVTPMQFKMNCLVQMLMMIRLARMYLALFFLNSLITFSFYLNSY